MTVILLNIVHWEDYQNCSVLYFVPQLYTIISTHTYEQFLQVY